MKAAAGLILVPFPLDQLVESGMETQLVQHQRKLGVMQCTQLP